MSIDKLDDNLLIAAAESMNDTFGLSIDTEQDKKDIAIEVIKALLGLSKKDEEKLEDSVYDFAENATKAFGIEKLNGILTALEESDDEEGENGDDEEDVNGDDEEVVDEEVKDDPKEEPQWEIMNMKSLREAAKNLGIPHINSKKREELIKEIKKASKAAAKKAEKPEKPKKAEKKPEKPKKAEKPKAEKKEREGNKVTDITLVVIENPLLSQKEISELLEKKGISFSPATLNFEYRAVHRLIPIAKKLGHWKD